jgi:hypothetical protein
MRILHTAEFHEDWRIQKFKTNIQRHTDHIGGNYLGNPKTLHVDYDYDKSIITLRNTLIVLILIRSGAF